MEVRGVGTDCDAKQLVVNRLSRARLHITLARQIRESILKGDLREGDRLPPEAELAEQAGVSRWIVREALRVLERSGLIQVRQGARGGAFVTVPGPDLMVDTMVARFHVQGLRIEELYQAKAAVEATIAQLAARNRDERDIALLKENLDATENQKDMADAAYECYLRFHMLITAASHNAVIQVLGDVLTQFAEEMTGPVHSAESNSAIRQRHVKIVDAIVERDEERAGRLMTAHVKEMASVFRGNDRP